MGHVKSLLLGATLVAVGVAIGRTYHEPQVKAQTFTGGGFFTDESAPAILTQSADGRTLYVWSFRNSSEPPPRQTPRGPKLRVEFAIDGDGNKTAR